VKTTFPLVSGILIGLLLIFLILVESATLLWTWSLSKDNMPLS
jgi:hypothetical protein